MIFSKLILFQKTSRICDSLSEIEFSFIFQIKVTFLIFSNYFVLFLQILIFFHSSQLSYSFWELTSSSHCLFWSLHIPWTFKSFRQANLVAHWVKRISSVVSSLFTKSWESKHGLHASHLNIKVSLLFLLRSLKMGN